MTDRPGFALVLSLLLTLALMTLALGVLAVGTREAAIAAAMARKARAGREAEIAAVEVVRAWSTEAVRDVPVGGHRRSLTDSVSGATIVRLDSGLYLVRGEGRVPGPDGVVVATAGLMVRTIGSPETLVPGAVTATGAVTVRGAVVQGEWTDSSAVRAAAGAGCVPDSAPGVVAPVVTVGTAALVTGAPPVDRIMPLAPPDPDPFAPSLAARLADVRLGGGVVQPEPIADGVECLPGQANWGSPDPVDPCHTALPLVFSGGDLTVSGGVGRLTLVVNGDLRITDGAVLHGVIVVHGHLEISGASVVRGAVRAQSVEVTGGTVTRDECAIRAASTGPALDRAFRPPSRWWIPLF